jgi:hypothetical protein
MWAVLLGTLVGGIFTLIGGVVAQVRQDRRVRIGAAELLRYEMVINAHAMEIYLEKFEEDPYDEEALGEAARDMVVHSSTAVWREHGPQLITLFDYDFREGLVAIYAAIISNEVDPGRHRHASWAVIEVLKHAQEQLAPYGRLTWVDRHVWRF